MTLKPGQYLQLRRSAAGFTLFDVAERLSAEPHVDVRSRAQLLERVEEDDQAISLPEIVALRRIFDFSIDVLVALERIAQGSVERPPHLCSGCGFTWPAEQLCTRCVSAAAAAVAA